MQSDLWVSGKAGSRPEESSWSSGQVRRLEGRPGRRTARAKAERQEWVGVKRSTKEKEGGRNGQG